MKFYGRGGEIRTPDPLVPNQMRYQTALRPVKDLLVEKKRNLKHFFYLFIIILSFNSNLYEANTPLFNSKTYFAFFLLKIGFKLNGFAL